MIAGGKGMIMGQICLGRSKGVQAQILQNNNLATFSPCASHTLNRVGVHAAGSSP